MYALPLISGGFADLEILQLLAVPTRYHGWPAWLAFHAKPQPALQISATTPQEAAGSVQTQAMELLAIVYRQTAIGRQPQMPLPIFQNAEHALPGKPLAA